MYRFAIFLATVFLLSLIPQYNIQLAQENMGYTLAEVIAAYEAGQFRIIYTPSDTLTSNSDGTFVYAHGIGIYRVRDGQYFEQFNSATFNPYSAYVVQYTDGVYRLSDLQQVVPIASDNHGVVGFSLSGEFVSISGEGVYRLSDGEQIIENDSLDINFSPDSVYIATSEGVYRLSDGARLFDLDGHQPWFSRDSVYVYALRDGLYRVFDGERLLDIPSSVSFTYDMRYVVVYGDGVYRLSDMQRMFGITGNSWPIFSPDRTYMAINGDGLYRWSDGQRLLDIESFHPAFSHDGNYIAIVNDGVYRLGDMQKLFDITGYMPEFSVDDAYVTTSVSNLTGVRGGVYRMSDGTRLLDVRYSAAFSPDSQYVAVDTDALYRLSDGQRLFDIENINAEFSANGEFVFDDSSIYRVSDGYQYHGLQLLNVSAGIMAIGNAILVIDQSVQGQSLTVVRPDLGVRPDINDHILYSEPNEDSDRVAYFNRITYLAVLDEQDDWYQVGHRGEIGWVPADRVTLFGVPE